MKNYRATHKKITGKTPDYWASGMVYATFQVLHQAIEAVGTTDRKAVTAHIKKSTFNTVMGPINFKNQNNVLRLYLYKVLILSCVLCS